MSLGPAYEAKRAEIHEQFAALIRGYLDEAAAEGSIPPLDTRVARAVGSTARRAALRRGRGREYRIDLACLRRRFPWERMPPPPVPESVQELLRPPHPAL